MKIDFLVNEVSGGWEPTDVRLGGTERGVVEWANELSDRGHEVRVYRNSKTGYHMVVGEVSYNDRDDYDGSGDITINVKSPEVGVAGPTIFYTNDVDADKQDLSHYGSVIHISNWAKDNIPVNNENVFVVPHGYNDKVIYPTVKYPQTCLYSSSPDRGLETLLKSWPKVKRECPDATLIVTYGAEGAEYPGIEYLGEVSEEEMDELYRTSDIWCHPANGGELQCIAGLKAQAAGCWPVVIPTMALQETIHYGTFATEDNYADKLVEALKGHPEQSYKGVSIEESTDKLLEVIQFTLDGYTSRKPTN